MLQNRATRILEDHLLLPDGTRRETLRWRPEGACKGRILLLHGFGNYRGMFAEIGPEFAGAGYDTLAFDQRGFGLERKKGQWPGNRKLLEDCAAVTNVFSSGGGDGPLIVIGESMGGALAIAATARCLMEPDALVLAAPAFRNPSVRSVATDIFLGLAAGIVPRKGIDIQHRSDVMAPEAVERFQKDPAVVRFASVSDYRSILRLASWSFDGFRKLKLPVLLAYGSDDEVIPAGAFKGVAAAARENVTAIGYEGAPHGLLHWRERGRVVADILSWLAKL